MPTHVSRGLPLFRNGVAILIVLAFSAYPSHSLLAQEFVIGPENILQFTYGDQPRRIWESIRNESRSPSFWQFRYDPIFASEVKQNGDLKIVNEKLPVGWRVSLPIFFSTPQSDKLAYDQIVNAYPEKAGLITRSNVSSLSVTNIQITIPELLDQIPTARFRDNNIDFSGPESRFLLRIDVPDERNADRVSEFLTKSPRINYVISLSAKTTKRNEVKVKYQHLQKSNLYSTLSGLGTTSTYVHRDDMRRLIEGIHLFIEYEGTLEAPENFDSELFYRVLSQLTKAVNTEKENFNIQEWESTYNADDLRPTTITKQLEKMFTYDQEKDQWEYNIDVDLSGKADVFGTIGIEAKVKGSYSTG